MTLTYKQCELLINIVNAGITRAVQSGIPIGQEYYKDIDTIKNELYTERQMAINRENGGHKT